MHDVYSYSSFRWLSFQCLMCVHSVRCCCCDVWILQIHHFLMSHFLSSCIFSLLFFSSFVRFFDNSLLRWAVQIIYQRVQFKMELVSLSQRNKKQLFLLIWNGIICLTTHLNSTIEDGRKKKSDRRWFSLLVMFMDIWFDIRYDRRT